MRPAKAKKSKTSTARNRTNPVTIQIVRRLAMSPGFVAFSYVTITSYLSGNRAIPFQYHFSIGPREFAVYTGKPLGEVPLNF